MLATEKQVDYMKSLYNQLGQEPEEGLESYTNWEVQRVIRELKEMLDDQNRY